MAGPRRIGSILRHDGRQVSVGAFECFGVQDDVARLLGRPVDLVTPVAMKDRLRERIEAEAVDVI